MANSIQLDGIFQHFGSPIGKGPNSIVQEVHLKGRGKCASKRFSRNLEKQGPLVCEKIIKEARCLAELHHPNIVEVIGYLYPSECKLPAIVSELMELSLEEYITDEQIKSEKIIFQDQMDILLGIASGLEFLHSKRISHTDLHDRNILLRLYPLVAKISDTGIKRITDVSEADDRLIETKLKCDVYSLGALILHVATCTTMNECSFMTEPPVLPVDSPLRATVSDCMSADLSQRPATSSVKIALQFISEQQSGQLCTPLFVRSDSNESTSSLSEAGVNSFSEVEVSDTESKLLLPQDESTTASSNTALSREQYIELLINDPAFNEAVEKAGELKQKIDEWLPVREETIEKIKEIIEKLKKITRDVNISKITGSSVSIVGGAVATAGFITSFFTFGATIPLMAVGIATAVAGGTTAAGAAIADLILSKLNMNDAEEAIAKDNEKSAEIKDILEKIDEMAERISKKHSKLPKETIFYAIISSAGRVGQAVNLTTHIGEILAASLAGTIEAGAVVFRVLSVAGRAVAIAGVVVNAVVFVLDIAQIIKSSIEIHKNSPGKTAEALMKKVEELEEQKKDLEEMRTMMEQ